MGEVVSLDQARAAKAARVRHQMIIASMHPCLRWVTGDDHRIAHRRAEAGDAMCGAAGDLALAPAGAALCGICYADL